MDWKREHHQANCAPCSHKAVFLDRDGILNVDTQYAHKPDELKLQTELIPLFQYLLRDGYLLFIVTNQSGIGRGYYTYQDFERFNSLLKFQLEEYGVTITDVFFCASKKNSDFRRKPNPGMLLEAQRKYSLNLEQCIMIGDKESDIQAGQNAGTGISILYRRPCQEALAEIRLFTKPGCIHKSLKLFLELLTLESGNCPQK